MIFCNIDNRLQYTYGRLLVLVLFSILVGCKATSSVNGIPKLEAGGDLNSYVQNHIVKGIKEISIPSGRYRVSATIILPPGSAIRGAGSNKTILFSDEGVKILIADVSNVIVSGLSLQSSQRHSSVLIRSGTYREKISARAVSNVLIEDVVVENIAVGVKGGHGISVKAWANEDVSNIVIRNCKVTGSWGQDINTGVDNCYIASYDSDGTGTVRDVLVEGCDFSIAGRQNLSVAGKGKSKPSKIIIRNCRLTHSTLAGIDLEEARLVKIEGCTFENNGTLDLYFDLGDKKNAMRSGLVCHRSEAEVTNCTFKDAFIGFSAVHKEGEGIKIEDCRFINAPVANGNFAGFGETRFINCQFTGHERPAVHFYRGRFSFDNCIFKGEASPLLRISGGGKPKEEAGMAFFKNSKFEGDGYNTCLTADYEFLKFEECSFRNYRSLLNTSGINRWNTFIFDKGSVKDVKYLGTFPYQSLQLLSISGMELMLTEGGVSSPTVNGKFLFVDNVFNLTGAGNILMKGKQFEEVALIGNTINRVNSSDIPFVVLEVESGNRVVIENNNLTAPTSGITSEWLTIRGKGVVSDQQVRVKNNKGLNGEKVRTKFTGTVKHMDVGQKQR